MNNDTIAGSLKQLKGKLQEQWGKLTDDDLDVIAGKRDQLIGKIQEYYGLARDEAEKQIARWEKRHEDVVQTPQAQKEDAPHKQEKSSS